MSEPLSAKERAEKIFYDVFVLPKDIVPGDVIKRVAAEIQEAEREAYKAGAEAAAKLAEDQDNSECKEICACPYRISKQIRALKTPEGGKRE